MPLVKAVHFLEDLELEDYPTPVVPCPFCGKPGRRRKEGFQGERAKASEAQARPLTAIPVRRIS